jgi:hypothetical protein
MGCLLVWGCGPTTGAYCEDQVECSGGNAEDEDACAAVVDYVEELADMQGCADEFDEYFECFFDNATCQTAQTGYSCSSTQECAEQGASSGAACINGSCVISRLALENSEVCRRETRALDACSATDINL